MGLREKVVVTQGTYLLFVLQIEQRGWRVRVRNKGERKRRFLRREKEITENIKVDEVNEIAEWKKKEINIFRK